MWGVGYKQQVQVTVDCFGRISGLKVIIDADDKVCQPKMYYIVSWPEITSYRIHVYVAFFMPQRHEYQIVTVV